MIEDKSDLELIESLKKESLEKTEYIDKKILESVEQTVHIHDQKENIFRLEDLLKEREADCLANSIQISELELENKKLKDKLIELILNQK